MRRRHAPPDVTAADVCTALGVARGAGARSYMTSHLLEMNRWHIFEYIDFMGSDECTHEALDTFARRVLLKHVHMSVLCHGNIDAAGATALVEEAATALGSRPLGLSQVPTPRLLHTPMS